MNKRTLYLIIIVLTTASCFSRRDARLTDKDLVINSRLHSPDRKHVVYNYAYDLGAFGFSRGTYAIVQTCDTNGVINKNEFYCMDKKPHTRYIVDKWIDNKTLHVLVDEAPFAKQGIPIDTSTFQIIDITIKVGLKDPTNGTTPIIEHYSVSPDGQKLLVAYLYNGAVDLNVSVININDKLPRLGNIFTYDQESNCSIMFGKWTDNNEVTIILDEEMEKFSPTEYNKQSDFKVKSIVEKYNPKYSEAESGWYNKQLYLANNLSQKLLKENLILTYAIIDDIFTWGDSYAAKLQNYSYVYNVKGKIYKSYFRANTEKCKLHKGDSIKVIYDRKQPIIHEPTEYNCR